MYQIVYLSRATRIFSDEAVQQLCKKSFDANFAHGVTGLLLFDGNRFIQALEGERDAVDNVMRRIVADRRHDSIVFLSDGLVETRQFGNWSMDYKRADEGCCSEGFLGKVKADVADVRDPALQAAFIGFASLSSSRTPGYRCSAA